MLLTFFFISLSFAQSGSDCAQATGPSGEAIETLLELVNPVARVHWIATPEQFMTAPCRASGAPTMEIINTFLESKTGDKDLKIGGVKFKDQSMEMLAALRDLVAGQNITSQMSVAPTCEGVLCAVERIWGPELGRKLLYMRTRHGFNGSEFAFAKSSRFTIPEINDVLTSLGALPAHMASMGRRGNQQLSVAAPGVQHPLTPEAHADAAITLYNKWRADVGTSPFITQYVLFHEYAHNISVKYGNADKSAEWVALNARPECRVSSYGNTNQIEDFAESVTMYRFNGPGLLVQCPDKYNYIRDTFFNGVEYLSEATCAGQ